MAVKQYISLRVPYLLAFGNIGIVFRLNPKSPIGESPHSVAILRPASFVIINEGGLFISNRF